MNLVETIHCKTPEFAEEMFKFYIKKGYAVLQSTVMIKHGVYGQMVVKQLDILEKEVLEPYPETEATLINDFYARRRD